MLRATQRTPHGTYAAYIHLLPRLLYLPSVSGAKLSGKIVKYHKLPSLYLFPPLPHAPLHPRTPPPPAPLLACSVRNQAGGQRWCDRSLVHINVIGDRSLCFAADLARVNEG